MQKHQASEQSEIILQQFFSIKESKCVLTLYEIYINNSYISSEGDISELLHCLRSAAESDRVTLYINNPGGCVATTFQIINAMEDCEAQVTAIADGEIASAATFIFLAADHQIVKRNTNFMFHCCHIDGAGLEKIADKFYELKFAKDVMDAFWRRYYEGFFTEAELVRMLDGKDYWLDASQVEKRLAKRSKFLKKQQST